MVEEKLGQKKTNIVMFENFLCVISSPKTRVKDWLSKNKC